MKVFKLKDQHGNVLFVLQHASALLAKDPQLTYSASRPLLVYKLTNGASEQIIEVNRGNTNEGYRFEHVVEEALKQMNVPYEDITQETLSIEATLRQQISAMDSLLGDETQT